MIDQQHLYFFFMFIPLCREIFYHKDGSPRSEGETIKDPMFAKTLTEISQNPMSFYNGSIARELAKDIKARGGIITEEDFKNFTVKERQVLKGSMTNDDTLYTTSAPSSGSTMIMMVNILKGGYSIWHLIKLTGCKAKQWIQRDAVQREWIQYNAIRHYTI